MLPVGKGEIVHVVSDRLLQFDLRSCDLGYQRRPVADTAQVDVTTTVATDFHAGLRQGANLLHGVWFQDLPCRDIVWERKVADDVIQ